MEIKLTKDMVEKIGKSKFTKFGVSEESWSWRSKSTMLDLARMDPTNINVLRMLLAEHADVTGVNTLLRDIETWKAAITLGSGSQKARSARLFMPLLIEYVKANSRHHLYRKMDEMADVFLAYYVSKIEWHEAVKYSPEHVSLHLIWEEFGGKKSEVVNFYAEHCRSMSVIEALARKSLFIESKDLRMKYIGQAKRFVEIVNKVGKQFWARGTATDDLDGNPDSREERWYWRQTHTLQMERMGEPTRIAVDVFNEDDKSARDKEEKINLNTWFWHNLAKRNTARNVDEDDDTESVDGSDEIPELEIPIHPLVAVFDFSKHLRLRIHIDYLTEYQYEKHMDNKLVLPDEIKTLVKMLIEHKEDGFTDVVKGKSGGAVVLLTGPPGVGKTLTAEVYAESEERALYSVQCSQLGVTPDELEEELLKVFARARRWNAVMLLDEADVYVRERGSDLNQNAIVGVFLRVLEYQSSVLFLTTNRPEDVDDAIASRCIARLNYGVPASDLQAKIWRVLADSSSIALSDKIIGEIVKKSEGLTGRDVKNLLKLAQLVSAANKKPITVETVEFVKRFKPTASKSAK